MCSLPECKVRDTANIWMKVLWSDDLDRVEFFGLIAKRFVWQETTLHLTLNTPCLLSSKLVATLCSGVLLFGSEGEDGQS